MKSIRLISHHGAGCSGITGTKLCLKKISFTTPGSTDDPNIRAVYMAEHGMAYSCFSEQDEASGCRVVLSSSLAMACAFIPWVSCRESPCSCVESFCCPPGARQEPWTLGVQVTSGRGASPQAEAPCCLPDPPHRAEASPADIYPTEMRLFI